MSEPTYTGIVCPACKRPLAVIMAETSTSLTLQCAACGHGWKAEEPRPPKRHTNTAHTVVAVTAGSPLPTTPPLDARTIRKIARAARRSR